MTCSVAEVDKVLLSVAKIVDKGNFVQFGPTPEQCFIQNIKSGKRMSLQRRRDVYVMGLVVIPPAAALGRESKTLSAVTAGAAPGRTNTRKAVAAWEQRTSLPGGSRQAVWL